MNYWPDNNQPQQPAPQWGQAAPPPHGWPQQPTQYYGGAPAPVPPKGSRNGKVLAALGAVVVGVLIGTVGYLVTSGSDTQADGPPPTTEAAERSESRPTRPPTTEPPTTQPPTTQPPATEPPTTDMPDNAPAGTEAPAGSSELTQAQKDAAEYAASFLEDIPSSRAYLIEVVVSIGVTEEDAAIAVDSLNVDWNQQAVLSAKWLLDLHIGFSNVGLHKELSSPESGFTAEQATYAVDNVEVDWNEQAIVRVEFIIDYGDNPTCDEILLLMTELYDFTPEMAEYGTTQVGVC